jgi:hypothetical protein
MRCLVQIVICHLAAGIVCAAAVDVNVMSIFTLIVNSLFTAVIGCDLCLLGIGVPVAMQRAAGRRKRVVLLVASTLWLWLLTFAVLWSAKPVSPPAFILLLAPAVSFAACVFGMAIWALGVRLVHTHGDTADDVGPFRFGIRHLFAVMAIVGGLLALGRICRDSGLHTIYMSTAFQVAVLLMLSVSTAGIAGITLWASLSRGAPLHRVPVAIAAAAAIGFLPGYYFDLPWTGYAILAAVAAVLSIISAVTLLAVRRCGFRLIHATSSRRRLTIGLRTGRAQ